MSSNKFLLSPSFSENEKNIIEYWKEKKIYEKLLDTMKKLPQFRFMDGPPFVSSDNLHYGHVLVGMLKSTILNYHQMMGKNALNRLGYDCHGLPIEMAVNKLLGIKTNQDVKDFGIDKYNKKCKETIKKYSGAWVNVYDRIGRSADFTNTYRTMDLEFMESVWWGFNQLWKKKLIYRGFKIMPYSTECGTPLSNFEAGQNYMKKKDMTVYVFFPMSIDQTKQVGFLAWTTTPWTLPSNLALCINPKAKYCRVLDKGNNKEYIIAQACIKNVFDDPIHYSVLQIYDAKKIIGTKYDPPFNYFNRFSDYSFTIIADDFVKTDDDKNGTGVVHMAPAFGQEDFKACCDNDIVTSVNIGEACPVDDNGQFTDKVLHYKGQHVLKTNKKIIEYLESKHLIIKKKQYEHDYPLCWRTGNPLIYKAVSSFFVNVTKIKNKIINHNKQIRWVPEHVGKNRFHKWLEGTKDWGVSRNRFFGTPIPIWESDDGQEMVCVGSIDELVKLAKLKERPTDLHLEFMKDITIESQSGKKLKLCMDVLDCWFESGSVPFAQLHFPFENKNAFKDQDYLTEFICEGLDQTRGWFYTLMVLSTAIFNKPAFRNVICSGLILDKHGKKISKSKGNFVNPLKIIDQHSADALRMYLISSPAARAEPIKFRDNDVKMVMKQYIPWINSVKFFLEMYTLQVEKNKVKFVFNAESKNMMDVWLLSRLGTLIGHIYELMSVYKVYKVQELVYQFMEELTNQYIKFNKDRFKGKYGSNDVTISLSVLHRVLLTFTKVMAPFAPFITEQMYQLLPKQKKQLSVHHCKYPMFHQFNTRFDIERKMSNCYDVIVSIRSIRSRSKNCQGTKTPIRCATISHFDPQTMIDIKEMEELIMTQTNVLVMKYGNIKEHVRYRAYPNCRLIGQKYKGKAKEVYKQIGQFNHDYLVGFLAKQHNLEVKIDQSDTITQTFALEKDEIEIKLESFKKYPENVYVEVNDGLLVIADTNLDEKVVELDFVRNFICKIQETRKEMGLKPWDDIKVYYKMNQTLQTYLMINMEIIQQKLKTDVQEYSSQLIDRVVEFNHKGQKCVIYIKQRA